MSHTSLVIAFQGHPRGSEPSFISMAYGQLLDSADILLFRQAKYTNDGNLSIEFYRLVSCKSRCICKTALFESRCNSIV